MSIGQLGGLAITLSRQLDQGKVLQFADSVVVGTGRVSTGERLRRACAHEARLIVRHGLAVVRAGTVEPEPSATDATVQWTHSPFPLEDQVIVGGRWRWETIDEVLLARGWPPP